MSEEKALKNSLLEENITTKVAELMETLDEVKKFYVLERYFNKFASIVIGSIVVLIIANSLLPHTNLLDPFDGPQRFLLTFLLVLIPISGITIGVFFIRRKIHAVKTGEWKEDLSHGFSSALKVLSEMNRESSFNALSSGGLSYAMYGLVKGAAYWIITYFALGFAFNIATYIVLHQTAVLGGASLWISLLVAFAYMKKDLSKRFNDIRAIDKLQWELRGFSYELRNAEF